MSSLQKTAQKLMIYFNLLTKRYEITNMFLWSEIKKRYAEMTPPRISVVTEQSSSQGNTSLDLGIAKRTSLHPSDWSYFLPNSA